MPYLLPDIEWTEHLWRKLLDALGYGSAYLVRLLLECYTNECERLSVEVCQDRVRRAERWICMLEQERATRG